ncbi:MAG: F0F1 ATP synthase subunit B, partial [Candidatus Bipolaricaulia bacterium]
NWTFILNLINFAILLFLLNRVLYRPVIRVMEERREGLAKRLAQAQRRRQEAEQLRARREAELAEARARARELIETARREGLGLLKEERAQALAEARRIIVAAEQEAAREREVLWQELQGELEELALASAAQILGRELHEAAS